jgi:hypothetical protein
MTRDQMARLDTAICDLVKVSDDLMLENLANPHPEYGDEVREILYSFGDRVLSLQHDSFALASMAPGPIGGLK